MLYLIFWNHTKSVKAEKTWFLLWGGYVGDYVLTGSSDFHIIVHETGT